MSSPKVWSRSSFAVHCVVLGVAWALVTAAGCSSNDAGPTGGGDASIDAPSAFDGARPDGTLVDGKADSEASTCSAGKTLCSGSCVDTTTDSNNCGGCGGKCGAGLVCSQSQCTVSCGTNLTQCGSGCYNTQTDPSNCGSCGNACSAGDTCSAGNCQVACGGGTTLCSGSCVDTAVDPSNCGGCGTTCVGGSVCSNGQCVASCAANQTICSADGGVPFCADTQSDNLNCGKCFNSCAAGLVCSQGACAVTCQASEVNCGGKCVDPGSNNNFCGATTGCGADAGSPGTVCTSGESCVGGTCQVTCPSGRIFCAGSCIDPQSNPIYCGATQGCGAGDAGTAGTHCSGGQVCSAGTCALSCPPGQVICGGGCIDPNTNPVYCGASSNCQGINAGTQCPADQVCSGGQCQLTCPSGLIACAGTCIAPTTNNIFCGASGNCQGVNAGHSCLAGYVCNGGSCDLSCQSGLIDCAGTCIDPQTNNAYCGASGSCDLDAGTGGAACNAGYVCNGGTCSLSCQTGLVNCNGTCVNPNTDPGHCGATTGCGEADAGGSAGEQCPQGYTCVGPAPAQCELLCPVIDGGVQEVACAGGTICVNPQTDNEYCGAQSGCTGATDCTKTAGDTCQGGSCLPTCPAGECYEAAAGQCIDPLSNVTYCGATVSANGTCDNSTVVNGTGCGSGTYCTTGDAGTAVCSATCASPQVLCAGSTYCSDLTSDIHNCGQCGYDCTLSALNPAQYPPTCVNSTCQITYTVETANLLNQTSNCTGGTKQSTSPTAEFGFEWQDELQNKSPRGTTPLQPKSMQITFAQGYFCPFQEPEGSSCCEVGTTIYPANVPAPGGGYEFNEDECGSSSTAVTCPAIPGEQLALSLNASALASQSYVASGVCSCPTGGTPTQQVLNLTPSDLSPYVFGTTNTLYFTPPSAPSWTTAPAYPAVDGGAPAQDALTTTSQNGLSPIVGATQFATVVVTY